MDDASGSNKPTSPVSNKTSGGDGDSPMALSSATDTLSDTNTHPALETSAVPPEPQELVKRQAVQLPLPEGIQPFDVSEYTVTGVLGTGSRGRVCQVKHISTGKVYAWKQLNVTGKDAIQKSTMRVMNLASTLKHPNIVNCLGIRSGFGEVWLLYDLMEHNMEGVHARDETVIATIGKDILEGLRFVNDQNIIHGDLKPSNILVSTDNIVKICDFAYGKTLVDILDKRYLLALCTILYMSPEAIDHKFRKEDCETGDIWSFGICMLEFCLGHYPIAFDRRNLYSVCEGIARKQPPDAPRGSSPEFQDFIRLCLQREPDKRGSIEQLLAHEFILKNTEENNSY